jgi:26S proteasome regulatory subunit N5
MAKLLGLSENAAEESLNAMVVAKSIEAKIDRLDGIVDFQQTQDPNEVNKIWNKMACFFN